MKGKEGITLVALTVTIIVLIILAGVSIQLILGDNGIIKKASYAKEQSSIAQAREKIELVLEEAKIDKFTKELYNHNEYLDEMIVNKIANSKVNEDIVLVDGHAFTLDRKIPRLIEYVGKEEELVFPKINTKIEIGEDNETATIIVTAQEEKEGIKKIEIWQNGVMIQSHSYETIESPKTDRFTLQKNGKYTVKVTSTRVASEIIEITDLISYINYTPNGSREWKKEYRIKLTNDEKLENVNSIKYQWTETMDEPNENTFSNEVEKDGIIIENSLTGKYYLWTLIEMNSGVTRIERSDIFYIDNTGPTAKIMTEWLEETEANKVKISISDIKDEQAGVEKNTSVSLYITNENGINQEKKIDLTDGEGSITIEGLSKDILTKFEVVIKDEAGNITKLERNVGRIYLVKDGIIVNGEKFSSYDRELRAPGDGEVRANVVTAGHLGTFIGLMLDVPTGKATLSCNISGAYRESGTGEATNLLIYLGDNYEIYNPGDVWPKDHASVRLCEYGTEIAPSLYRTTSGEIEGRAFMGFFQVGNVSGGWYERVIGFTDMYLDYE